MLKLVKPQTNSISFDPLNLGRGQVNGFLRFGKAAKIGKSKKITKQCTVGVPLFFSKYIYMDSLPKEFPFRLLILDSSRKKMGKKRICY